MGYLRIRRLGKAYKRYSSKWGRAAEWLGLGTQHELAWVLRDVSFDVAPGEAVGIVGANGAGKSTLLKVIAGTVRPSAGTYEVGGRIAALLELGMGFHPEFTGRQNVYMSGHILGLSADRVASLMNDIEDFAEIGDYVDQPVRTYSSGMQVRLAFSVATAVRPDILMIDEALSVGDTYFQHKSFDRIRTFREQGTTLLFVSHSAGAIKTLCDRALLIDQGLLLRDDMPDAIVDYYNAMIAAHRADHQIRVSEGASNRRSTRSGTAEATIENVDLLIDGISVRTVRSGSPLRIRIVLLTKAALHELTVGILIRDRLGNDVYGTNTFHLGTSRQRIEAGERITVEFTVRALDVGIGTYSLTVALHPGDSHVPSCYDWWDRALLFQVFRGDRPNSIGVCSLEVGADWDAGGSECAIVPRGVYRNSVAADDASAIGKR